MRARKLVAAGVLAAAVAVACPARAAEPTDPVGRYNLACKHALAGERDAAFEWLDKAIAVGFGSVDVMEKDPDLASLRGDARWRGVVDKARAKANPCKTLPEARQLDFWVGEWDVHDPAGRLVGHSSMAGGRVRQLAEASSDGGKSWSVRYDLTYSRRPPRSGPAAP